MKWRSLEESHSERHFATLREELEERKALAEQYVPADVQEINRHTVEGLCASDMVKHVLAPGQHAPSFELPDQAGNATASAGLLSQGRLVICFFRGRWCPFCVAQLEAMNSALFRIRKAGAGMVAISPQTVKQSFFMHDQHQFGFPLLSDSGNQVARQFGLVYSVPEEQKQVYSQTFVNLPFLNGQTAWELPIPATYILERDGAVLYASADPDYTRRPEPEEIVQQLTLGTRQAAG